MELSEKLNALEEDINLIKVEIKTVLVDLREELLKRQGPLSFGGGEAPVIDFVRASNRAPQGRADIPQDRTPPGAEPDGTPPRVTNDDQPAVDFGLPAAAVASPGPADTGPWGVIQIASLGKWAETASRRVGRRRLEELLSVYGLLTGRDVVAVKEALLRMVDLCGVRAEPEDVTMNDVLVVLSQLDALFRSHNLTEVTVLSMLSEVA